MRNDKRRYNWKRVILISAILGVAIGFVIPITLNLIVKISNVFSCRIDPTFTQPARAHYSNLNKDPLLVESCKVKGTLWGTVGTMKIHKIYKNTDPSGEISRVVDETISTPPCSAIYDFWITEEGEKIPAVVVSKSMAEKDYNSMVSSERDPGLISYHNQGVYKFSIFPVLRDGTPKHSSYKVDSLYEINENGWIEVVIPMGNLAIKCIEVNLLVFEPRAISRWDLPEEVSVTRKGSGCYELNGTFENLEKFQDDIKLRWSLEAAAVSKPDNGKINYQGLKLSDSVTLYQVAGIPCGIKKTSLSLLSRKIPSKGPLGHVVSYDLTGRKKTLIPVYPDKAIPVGEIPSEIIRRLETSAQISDIFNNSRLLFDKESLSARRMLNDNSTKMAELSLQERIVSPVASLYAKPKLTKDGNLTSFNSERGQIWVSGASDRLFNFSRSHQEVSGEASSTWFGKRAMTFMAPNFSRSRARGNCRACFANQKMILGALAMHNLDFNHNTLRDKNSFGGDLVGCVLFEPTIGFEGFGAYWHDHLVETSIFGTLGSVYEDLKSGGYLHCIPRHPGDNKHPDETYVFLNDQNIFCLRHGFCEIPKGLSKGASAKQQLLAYGITDKGLIIQASELPSGNKEIEKLSSWSVLWTLQMYGLDLICFVSLTYTFFRSKRALAAASIGMFLTTLNIGGCLACNTFSDSIIPVVSLFTIVMTAMDSIRLILCACREDILE